ncbi:hypothetical protein K1719_036966 [Acacia pycnantha]|nr:hypothetical protein K1719_036966 [Acacia pycnantha]
MTTRACDLAICIVTSSCGFASSSTYDCDVKKCRQTRTELREERRRKEEEIGEEREGERSSHHHLLRRRYPPSSQLESVSLRHHLIIVDFSHSFITVSATIVILFPSSITALFRRESQATIIAFSILIHYLPVDFPRLSPYSFSRFSRIHSFTETDSFHLTFSTKFAHSLIFPGEVQRNRLSYRPTR